MLYTDFLQHIYRAFLGPLPPRPPHQPPSALVLVADGIAGLNFCSTSLQYAASWAGLDHHVQLVPWGHGFGRWFQDLTDTRRHAEQSALVAQTVREFRSQHPQTPVFLVGKSGGSGIMIRALEQLPDAQVHSAILLASALSPRYDLTPALRNVAHQIVSFYSPIDFILLGIGTTLFGSIDRRHTPSAGLIGFTPPDTADPAAYSRLRQIPWSLAMARTGHLGGHVGPDTPWFLRTHVVPLLSVT